MTVLDDPKEMKKGRQKELNSLKEMGALTAVKRSEAVGKRVIQTRWLDRGKDGRVKSRLVLKDLTSTETTGALSPRCSHRHHRRDRITIAIHVHTAFLHADVDQEVFAEPPEGDEW